MQKLILTLMICVFVFNINAQTEIISVSQGWEAKLNKKQLKSILSLNVDYMDDELRLGNFQSLKGTVLKGISLTFITNEGEKKYNEVNVVIKRNYVISISCENCLAKKKKNGT